MTGKAAGEGRGLLESLTMLAATLVGIAHTRLELLSSDLEEAREYLFLQQVLLLAALFFVGIGVVLTAILIVAAFWDTHRLLALAGLAGFFMASGAGAWLYAIHRAGTRPRMFAASLSELFKDRQQLVSVRESENPAEPRRHEASR